MAGVSTGAYSAALTQSLLLLPPPRDESDCTKKLLTPEYKVSCCLKFTYALTTNPFEKGSFLNKSTTTKFSLLKLLGFRF